MLQASEWTRSVFRHQTLFYAVIPPDRDNDLSDRDSDLTDRDTYISNLR